MAKEEKETTPAEFKFAERMQDFMGITIIKADKDLSKEFVDRLTDSSGIEVIKKEPENTRVD
jgi:hypothetical protein